jgi:hypothetical protein
MVVGLMAIALVVAACGSTDDGDSANDAMVPTTGAPFGLQGGDEVTTEGTEAPPADEGAADGDDSGGEAEAPRDASGGGTGSAPVVFDTTDLGRSIIYTATLDLQVDDVAAATRAAQQQIAAVGGVVFSQDTITAPQARTTIVFRVQPADFAEAMNRLEGIGRVLSQDVSADDVTDRVVDLRSRILTAEVSVERLRRLLDGATTVEAIAALEGQLLDRETNLELLRGQLRTIEAQVSLATITVTISEEGAEATVNVAVTAYDGDDEGARCPGERRLDVDEGESVIVCVSIENTGNVDVSDIEVRDLGLDLRRDDFTLVDFTDDDVLAPGDEVIAWARIEAAPRRHPNPSVTVVPVDDEGQVIRQTTTVSQEDVSLGVVEDTSLPGFVESLSLGWGALVWIFAMLVVAVGVLAPLLLVAVPVAAGVIWWRRRDVAPAGEAPPVQ